MWNHIRTRLRRSSPAPATSPSFASPSRPSSPTTSTWGSRRPRTRRWTVHVKLDFRLSFLKSSTTVWDVPQFLQFFYLLCETERKFWNLVWLLFLWFLAFYWVRCHIWRIAWKKNTVISVHFFQSSPPSTPPRARSGGPPPTWGRTTCYGTSGWRRKTWVRQKYIYVLIICKMFDQSKLTFPHFCTFCYFISFFLWGGLCWAQKQLSFLCFFIKYVL